MLQAGVEQHGGREHRGGVVQTLRRARGDLRPTLAVAALTFRPDLTPPVRWRADAFRTTRREPGQHTGSDRDEGQRHDRVDLRLEPHGRRPRPHAGKPALTASFGPASDGIGFCILVLERQSVAGRERSGR